MPVAFSRRRPLLLAANNFAGVRETVDKLILDEMRAMGGGPAAYRAELPAVSAASSALTPALQAALKTVEDGKKLSAGVAVPDMSTVAAPAEDSAEGWELATARAEVAVEAQTLRSINAELMSKYGVEAWQGQVAGLVKHEASMKARVAALQAQIDAANAGRKAQQERVKGKLEVLGKRTYAAIESVTQVQLAVADADAEVRRLKRIARDAGLIVDEEAEAAASSAAASAAAARAASNGSFAGASL